MRILVLDDSKERLQAFQRKLIGHNVVTIMTASEAIQELENSFFDYVFLDHDLSDQQMVPSGPGTGYEVAQWLAEHVEKQPLNIVIHSFNPVGARG
jgi:Response regulator receiver domain.